MGRAPCCDKENVKKGPWSPEEDARLRSYIETNGTGGNWITLPHKSGLRRCGKSCRLRWLNYLRPNIKRGGFTEEEDYVICNLYNNIGSRWSVISSKLPGRTDNDVKNYWNTKLKKKLLEGKITIPLTQNNVQTTMNDSVEPSEVGPFNSALGPENEAINTFELSSHYESTIFNVTNHQQNIPYKYRVLDQLAQDPLHSRLDEGSSISGFGVHRSSSSVASEEISSNFSSSSSTRVVDQGDEFWWDLLFDSLNDFRVGSDLEKKVCEISSLLQLPSVDQQGFM